MDSKATVTIELTRDQIELLRRVSIFTTGFDDFDDVSSEIEAIWFLARDAQYDQLGD